MHKVHGHFWNSLEGRMNKHVRVFPTLREAQQWIDNSGFHGFDVYDDNEQLVHTSDNNTPDYA